MGDEIEAPKAAPAPASAAETAAKTAESPMVADLPTFLATVPPGSERLVKDWYHRVSSRHPTGTPSYYLRVRDVSIYCPSATCEREQLSSPVTAEETKFGIGPDQRFINLVCKNCQKLVKSIAVSFGERFTDKPVKIRKLGEFPHFGPPTPTRLISMLGKDKVLYEKGRRAESQNMGIAAYAYYRRVVENRKDEIIDRFIDVAKKLKASEALVAELEAAKKETQFSTAVEKVRHGIPDVLKIEGYNPLTLLHDALSDGLHKLTDEDCLRLAQDVRNVLVAMAERMAYALAENEALRQSVTALAKRHAEKKSKT